MQRHAVCALDLTTLTCAFRRRDVGVPNVDCVVTYSRAPCGLRTPSYARPCHGPCHGCQADGRGGYDALTLHCVMCDPR